MTTGATGQLGLALPVQGELSGTWGDTVNNGITQYTNIAIAATLTLTNDGAVTLANTTGDASASNITSSLTGAGTVTAQFAIVRITGTLTTTKVVTAPSYSKTYVVVNAATGGTVTFKASGQTGVSIAVGESAYVYYNGTDYVKVATTTYGTGDVVGPASATANGIALFNSTTGKLIKDSAASDGLIYGLTVGRGAGAVATNTAVGASALAANTSGLGNTATGSNALLSNTTGTLNTAVGKASLYSNTTGSQNSSFGYETLFANTTGGNNTAFGQQALASNTTASNNTAVGYQAGYSNTTGTNLVAIGTVALAANTTGSQNIGIGRYALTTNTTGGFNTAVGHAALSANSTASYNTAFGSYALENNSTGASNTSIGYQALAANTTTSNSTAVGYQALYTNTTGNANVAVGSTALAANTTGGSNTAVGRYALQSNTTASNNTALGQYTLPANTTGVGNTAVGSDALATSTTGSYNTALGYLALNANTTASNNTAVGYQAGYSNTAGSYLTAFGYKAGYSATLGSGNFQCVYIGNSAGESASSGTFNTFVGGGAGYLVTTGGKNTLIGAYSGNQGSLDIRTSNNYVVLSDGDGNPRMYFDTNGIANLRSSMLEQMTISATAATGTINFDAVTQSVLYYTTNASGNFTMNIRGNSGTTLNNSMVTGQSLTVAFLCTNGSTAYYQSAMTIDGSSVTPKWQGGTAPTTGNASAIDSYVYTIIKTASATFTVLASQTKFA